jgi:hypothetical protein
LINSASSCGLYRIPDAICLALDNRDQFHPEDAKECLVAGAMRFHWHFAV